MDSLVQRCQHYIVIHLEEFPVSHLSLLSLSMRRDLLWQLPIADICLWLENTEFTAGLDMAAFWSSTWNRNLVGVAETPHDRDDVKRFVKDKWDGAEYARETVYGIVATCTLSHLPDMEFRGILQPTDGHKYEIETNKQLEWGMPVISFLYAIRKPYAHHQGRCRVEFPPRYSHMSNKCDNDLTIVNVINIFSHGRGEFPRIFPEFVVMTDADEDINLDRVYHFLRNAVYLGINGNPFVERGLEFIKAVLNEASNLEVLLLDHWGKEEREWETELEPKCFDEFCAYLSSNKAFLSRFRLLKILSSIEPNEFVISQKNFNKLITAYFAAPTDHVQKLHITHTTIKCSDFSYECSPKIDQRYLTFKTLQLDDCQFVSKYEATPQTISHWLGRGISELPQSDHRPNAPGAYFFKVEDKTSGLSRKRKHSDLEQSID